MTKKITVPTSEGYRLLFIYLDTGNTVIYGPVVEMGPFIDADAESKAPPLYMNVTGTCRMMVEKIMDNSLQLLKMSVLYLGDEKV